MTLGRGPLSRRVSVRICGGHTGYEAVTHQWNVCTSIIPCIMIPSQRLGATVVERSRPPTGAPNGCTSMHKEDPSTNNNDAVRIHNHTYP